MFNSCSYSPESGVGVAGCVVVRAEHRPALLSGHDGLVHDVEQLPHLVVDFQSVHSRNLLGVVVVDHSQPAPTGLVMEVLQPGLGREPGEHLPLPSVRRPQRQFIDAVHSRHFFFGSL